MSFMEKTIFTNRWYGLKPSKSVKNIPKRVEFLGRDVVVWRNKENNVVIQDDLCPHRGARLSMGSVDRKNSCITCPYHGWKFDDEGVLKELPADGASNLVDNYKINTYETMESGGLIWACIGKPDGYNPPVIKEMHSRNWISVTGDAIFENDWLTTLENALDVSHVNFVHSDFGDAENGHVDIDSTSEVSEEHLLLKSTIRHKSESILLKFTENPNVKVTHDVLLPNTVSIKFWVRNYLKVITYVTYTPLSNNRTLLNWVFLRSPKYPIVDWILNPLFIDGMEKAIKEDKLIVESIMNPPNRINTTPDKIQIMFRNQLEKLKLSEPTVKY